MNEIRRYKVAKKNWHSLQYNTNQRISHYRISYRFIFQLVFGYWKEYGKGVDIKLRLGIFGGMSLKLLSNTSSLKGANSLILCLQGHFRILGNFGGTFCYLLEILFQIELVTWSMENLSWEMFWLHLIGSSFLSLCISLLDLQWWNSLIVQSFSTGNQKFDPRKHFRWAEIFLP